MVLGGVQDDTLGELDVPGMERVAQVAAQAAGWSQDRVSEEMHAYRERVRTRYQVQE